MTDRVPVLMYHRVGTVRDPAERLYCVSPGRFAAQMDALAKHGYHAVGIDAFVDWLTGGPPLPPGAFVLTFDDGFKGVREHALPVLARLGWPFAVFLVSDLLGGVDAWNQGGQHGGGGHPLLAIDDIRAMQAQGVSFHSHTRRHQSLPEQADDLLRDELMGSRADLEAMLAKPVQYLAYPYGHTDARVANAAAAVGYTACFTVRPGFNRQRADPLNIRRLDVWGTDTASALLRKIRLGSNDGSWRAYFSYGLRRLYGRFTKTRAPRNAGAQR